MSNYAALATIHRRGRIVVGQEGGGWGDLVSSILSAGGEMAKRGIESAQTQEKRQAEERKGKDDLATAIAADRLASDARARAMTTEALKQPSADADRQAADLAEQAQDLAGSGLSPPNQKKRTDAARDAVKRATAEWQRDPSSVAKKARVDAAQRTLVKAQGAQLAMAAQPGGMPSIIRGESQWPKRAMAGGILGVAGMLLGAVLAKNHLAGALAGLVAGGVLGIGSAYAMERS